MSKFHLLGGDVVWNIGTGYFACGETNDKGARVFNPQLFKENAAKDQVKMIEIKVGVSPARRLCPLPPLRHDNCILIPLIARALACAVDLAVLAPGVARGQAQPRRYSPRQQDYAHHRRGTRAGTPAVDRLQLAAHARCV